MSGQPEEAPADVMAEIVRLRDACRTLGKIVVANRRVMEAARIELAQGSAEKAAQWILNSLPDVWDDGPDTEWDGKESAREWYDRVEAADRAAEAASEERNQ